MPGNNLGWGQGFRNIRYFLFFFQFSVYIREQHFVLSSSNFSEIRGAFAVVVVQPSLVGRGRDGSTDLFGIPAHGAY